MKDIDGVDQPLSRYKGKVLLIVNVASRCGFTPQYEKLEKLYQAHKDAGLVVIGVPANNFLGQEPGSNAEIKEFCSGKYGVTFPLMAKVSVKGDDIAPLYKQLTEQASPIGGEITWNFNKFVVDRSGRVVARFDSRTSPEDPALVKRITDLLAASPEAK
ncbi:MAG TPA: glutathione peroxidase [Phycisphaerales bacterium]|nr:glutathione peroxidase [Phycisphaerales bacterium]